MPPPHRTFSPSPMDLGLQDVPDDQKVNLGACLLRSALSQWGHSFSRIYLSGAPLPGLDDPITEQLPHFHPDLPPAGKGGGRCRLGALAGADCTTYHQLLVVGGGRGGEGRGHGWGSGRVMQLQARRR